MNEVTHERSQFFKVQLEAIDEIIAATNDDPEVQALSSAQDKTGLFELGATKLQQFFLEAVQKSPEYLWVVEKNCEFCLWIAPGQIEDGAFTLEFHDRKQARHFMLEFVKD